MIRRPPRSTRVRSSAASDVYKRQGTDRTSANTLWQSYLAIDNPMIETISEMGGSMKTVAYTLELVPSLRDYDNGLGYIYGLSTEIPNFLGSVHPAIARGTASDWLVSTVAPWNAAQGG